MTGTMYPDNFSLSFVLNIQLQKIEESARLFLLFKEDYLFYIGKTKSMLTPF